MYKLARERNADVLGELLAAAFHPWQTPTENDSELQQNERNLVERASTVAVLIMSQPSGYEFRWRDDSIGKQENSNSALVVLPGFWKTTDEQGQLLKSALELQSPATAYV